MQMFRLIDFPIVFLLGLWLQCAYAVDYTASPLNMNVSRFGRYIEGACFDKNGVFYAANFEKTTGDRFTIGRITPGANGVTGKIESSFSADGAIINGIRFDNEYAYLADVENRRVLKVSYSNMNKSTSAQAGDYTVHCASPNMLYGVPNDIELAKNGVLYLSGQNWGQNKGELWRCSKTGVATKLDSMKRTNGITLSPDDSILYVSEAGNDQNSQPIFNQIWKYDVTESGVTNKRIFFNFTALGSGNIDIDGMRTDVDGNLYVTRNGARTVVKINPSGQIIKTITLSILNPTNLDFGGKDGKTIYVVGRCENSNTNRGCIDSFTVERPGRDFAWLQSLSQSQSSTTKNGVTTGYSSITTNINIDSNTSNGDNNNISTSSNDGNNNDGDSDSGDSNTTVNDNNISTGMLDVENSEASAVVNIVYSVYIVIICICASY